MTREEIKNLAIKKLPDANKSRLDICRVFIKKPATIDKTNPKTFISKSSIDSYMLRYERAPVPGLNGNYTWICTLII